jgi:hypothetical protein
MIGIWSAQAQTFLLWFTVITTVFFVIPLFFVPIRWARVLQWNIPDDTDLAEYFGRCLGALGLVVMLIAARAALTGQGLRIVYEVLIAIFVLMILVHAYGALRRIQPMTETLEIVFWAVLLVLGLGFFPVA